MLSAILWVIAEGTAAISVAIVATVVALVAAALAVAVLFAIFIFAASTLVSILECVFVPLVVQFFCFARRPPVIIEIPRPITQEVRDAYLAHYVNAREQHEIARAWDGDE